MPKLKLDCMITEPIHVSENYYDAAISSGKVKIFAADVDNNHKEQWEYKIFD
ncbi:MAG: hypothetical protein LBC19_07275 [Tannerella sp.]|jgi:RNA-binding protein YlmH|nr:hypothetical protein [Tannerella sp.]